MGPMNYRFLHITMSIALMLAVGLGLSACKPQEQDRVLLYKKGTYQGKADDPIGMAAQEKLSQRIAEQGGFGPSLTGPASAGMGAVYQAKAAEDRIRFQSDPDTGGVRPTALRALGQAPETGNPAGAQPAPQNVNTGSGADDTTSPTRLLSEQQRLDLQKRLSRQQGF
ncbi:MAG: hypothetical protein ACPGO3_14175 [Magnetospiraceae bacterium]